LSVITALTASSNRPQHHVEKNGLVTEDIIIENKKNTPLKYIEVSP
jgi:hypothetical protein